jgi:hypothetical protein
MRLSVVSGLLPLFILSASAANAAQAAASLSAQPVRPTMPAQRPQPAPAPVRSTAPAPAASAAWADAALTPGRWTYQRAQGQGTRALFGLPSGPLLVVACEPGRQISITRSGGGAAAMTIRTSSTARTLAAAPTPAGLRAQVPAIDPLLDAIAFSRGRFAVETQGAFALVIPNWPELARVVEDCRR